MVPVVEARLGYLVRRAWTTSSKVSLSIQSVGPASFTWTTRSRATGLAGRPGGRASPCASASQGAVRPCRVVAGAVRAEAHIRRGARMSQPPSPAAKACRPTSTLACPSTSTCGTAIATGSRDRRRVSSLWPAHLPRCIIVAPVASAAGCQRAQRWRIARQGRDSRPDPLGLGSAGGSMMSGAPVTRVLIGIDLAVFVVRWLLGRSAS